MRRVVITGIGALTPLGNDINSTWENLKRGRSGISKISRFDVSGLQSGIAGELKGFSPEKYLPRKDVLRLDPFVQYAATAAAMAVEDAGLKKQLTAVGSPQSDDDPGKRSSRLPEAAAVIIGSSRGGISSIEKAVQNELVRKKRYSAYLMSATTTSMAASYVSKRFGIKGHVLGISTACASGSDAIGAAYQMIREGRADLVLAGGADAPLSRLAVGGYGASGALSRNNDEPEKASRPFDRDRDGFVLSEGACILILEELDHAKAREAGIYAEIAGHGASSDAFHQTQPAPDGEACAIGAALRDASVTPDEIGYINAHATSTPLGDHAEARAIEKVFGKRAKDIPVSACKSMLGHMLGAAGAFEAALTALTLKRGVIVPTINLDNPDPGCDLNVITVLTSYSADSAISSSFGFGGVNSVLVLKRFT